MKMMKILTKKQFFNIILDGKSYKKLKNTRPENLHYLQLIFFNTIFAKIAITLYLLTGIIPIILVKSIIIKSIIIIIVGYADYKNRHYIKGILKPKCLYEIIEAK